MMPLQRSGLLTRHLHRVLQQPKLSRFFSTSALESSSSTLDDHVAELVHDYATKNQTSASLETLMKTGRGELLGKTYKEDSSYLNRHMATERILMQVASFIRKEMPIRLACRILDLDQVPMMRDMPSIQVVKDIYIQSFLELVEQPKIRTPQDEQAFASLLEKLYIKHSNILMQMARGAYELREAVKAGYIQGSTHNGHLEFENMDGCHDFLNRFYMSRIGIRVLAGQYLALRGEPLPTYVGMICSHTSPYELVERAIHDATLMCERKYGEAPHVEMQGSLHLTFPYIPTHLHYILLELLKNAMRATMEKHAEAGGYPPVTVIIADGTENEDVVIKVADEGGGICRSQVDKIWSYLYTTADPAIQEVFLNDHSADSPIAGLGYGLPISRSYCRYFGGDLDIMSLEGYGTDAYIHRLECGRSQEWNRELLLLSQAAKRVSSADVKFLEHVVAESAAWLDKDAFDSKREELEELALPLSQKAAGGACDVPVDGVQLDMNGASPMNDPTDGHRQNDSLTRNEIMITLKS